MGSKSPAFQFYPKDWLSSLSVLMMTPAEEGAYIRLLCYCWDSGDCSVPDDDDALAAMSRLGEGWLKGGSSKLRKCFIAHPDKPGFLTNERMLKERRSQAEWSRKSSEGGKKSAAQRAEKQKKLKGGSGVVQPTPNRTVQPNPNTTPASASSSAKGVSLTGYTAEFEDVWRLYPRRDGSKAEAFKSYQNAIQKGTDHGQIIEGVRQFSAHVEREGVENRHVAHAVTWLNQRRWEADYASAARDARRTGRAAGGKSDWQSAEDAIAARRFGAPGGGAADAPGSHQQALRAPEAVREDGGRA